MILTTGGRPDFVFSVAEATLLMIMMFAWRTETMILPDQKVI